MSDQTTPNQINVPTDYPAIIIAWGDGQVSQFTDNARAGDFRAPSGSTPLTRRLMAVRLRYLADHLAPWDDSRGETR